MELDLREIIDKNKNEIDNIEIYYYEAENTPVEFKNNKLFSIDKKYITGMGVRVIHKGKIGASSTNDFNKLDATVKAAKESAAYGEKAGFEFPDGNENNSLKKDLSVYDREFENSGNDKFIDSMNKGIQRIIRDDKSIKCEADISFSKKRIIVANSNNLYREFKKTTMYSCIQALLLEKEGGFQWISDCDFNTHKISSADRIADFVIEQIECSRTIVTFKTENLPVIFMPSAAYLFFSALQLAANGVMLQKGISPLSDKTGKKVIDERLTITDDPLLERMYGSMPFDCEGTPCRRNVIFKDGIFQDFIFDLETASRMNRKSTGNAVRSYSSRPSPGYSNFIVSNGNTKSSDMIKGLKRAVIVYELIGAGQSNMLSGDYSANIGLGFLIENGNIKGRIKNAMIAGNVYEDLLNNIEDISSDTRTIEGYTFPGILFREKKVVG